MNTIIQTQTEISRYVNYIIKILLICTTSTNNVHFSFFYSFNNSKQLMKNLRFETFFNYYNYLLRKVKMKSGQVNMFFNKI